MSSADVNDQQGDALPGPPMEHQGKPSYKSYRQALTNHHIKDALLMPDQEEVLEKATCLQGKNARIEYPL